GESGGAVCMPRAGLLDGRARRGVRRRTTILQILASTADLVNSALLKGKLFSKITTFMAVSK
ncbi:MAG: hypothetical protein J7L16_09310, partial [Deltaproteobacteria bacterium]|nr:hypothetical protein [Deltaproteobacteria bacterium]